MDLRMTSQLPAFRSTLHALMASYQDRLAARIRAERKSRGLSREEAARLAGISFRQYQRWETGTSEPRDANLRQLAEAWDIPVDELRPPDPEHEEAAVRDQLDRIEDKLDAVLRALGVSDEPLEPPARQAADAAERLAQRAEQTRRSSARGQPARKRRSA